MVPYTFAGENEIDEACLGGTAVIYRARMHDHTGRTRFRDLGRGLAAHRLSQPGTATRRACRIGSQAAQDPNPFVSRCTSVHLEYTHSVEACLRLIFIAVSY